MNTVEGAAVFQKDQETDEWYKYQPPPLVDTVEAAIKRKIRRRMRRMDICVNLSLVRALDFKVQENISKK